MILPFICFSEVEANHLNMKDAISKLIKDSPFLWLFFVMALFWMAPSERVEIPNKYF